MKPQLYTVTLNLNNQRLEIKTERRVFKILKNDFKDISNFLWISIARMAQKNKNKNFKFEVDKEELLLLWNLREQMPTEKEVKQETKKSNILKAPSTLQAISCHAPHAYAICLGLKPEEYRTRPTKNIERWVLIHSSQSQASDSFFRDYGIDIRQIKIARGAIIGAAFIEYCEGSPGDYAYGISKYKLFDKPLKGISGKQSIFWGAKSEREIKAFNEAWSMIEG